MLRCFLSFVCLLLVGGFAFGDIKIDTKAFCLTIGNDAIVKSLVVKATGEEMLANPEKLPLATITQARYFHNEIKLAYPCAETTLRANRISREGDLLRVGFELVPYEALVRIDAKDGFIGFELVGFDRYEDYHWFTMDMPPVKSLTVQLPVKPRENFGEWLNVMWDKTSALAMIALNVETRISHEKRAGFTLFKASADAEIRLIGAKAALIASSSDKFLSTLDVVENEYDLPRGVKARRSDVFNASVFWVEDLNASNLEEYLEYAKRGGFRAMLLYHTVMCECPGDYPFDGFPYDYADIGEYRINHNWRDAAGVRKLCERIHREGIHVGFHVLHPFVGFNTSFVYPVADHRLALKRHFTLRSPVGVDATEFVVEENPIGSPTNRLARVLMFDGELISYEGYTTSPPYRFFGLQRGHLRTRSIAHSAGQIGGVLDVTEFGGTAAYVDQRTDFQDELADRIAAIYNNGFDFLCLDGCEGTQRPYEIQVAHAQYRVWKKLRPEPLFTEGAAKAHFAWHHLSGANAFDIFPPEKFKAMIDRWPLHEAKMVSKDFSRVNFGWWGMWCPGDLIGGKPTIGTQYDMWEYGTSKAAAWDSPTTIQFHLNTLKAHPRTKDLLEVMRRWEDVRVKHWLTDEQKKMLRESGKEFHLYVDECGNYELHPIRMLPMYESAPDVRGFEFVRKGRRMIAYWNVRGEGKARVPWGKGGEFVEILTGDLKYLAE